MDLFTRKCGHNKILRRFEHCELCLDAAREAVNRTAPAADAGMTSRDMRGLLGDLFALEALTASASMLDRAEDALLQLHMSMLQDGSLLATSEHSGPADHLVLPLEGAFARWWVFRSREGVELMADGAGRPGYDVGDFRVAKSLIIDANTITRSDVQSGWEDVAEQLLHRYARADAIELQSMRSMLNGTPIGGVLARMHGHGAHLFEPHPTIHFHDWRIVRSPYGLVFEADNGPTSHCLRARHPLRLATPFALERYHVNGAWRRVRSYLDGAPYSGEVTSEMLASPRLLAPMSRLAGLTLPAVGPF